MYEGWGPDAGDIRTNMTGDANFIDEGEEDDDR